MNVSLGDAEFRRIQGLMQEASGIKLSEPKRALVSNRLQGRLRQLGMNSFKDYLARVASDPVEKVRLVDTLTVNETRFFRESRHFDLLQEALPAMGSHIRLWSGACSTGQEPYSLAMTLATSVPNRQWEIVASDLSHTVLKTASDGIYPQAAAADIPSPLLRRFCLRGVDEMAGYFRVRQSLRSRIQFRFLNLMASLPGDLGHFDVIFLRNVLIYFDAASKAQILKQVLRHLRPGGLLFLGHSETVHGMGLQVSSVAPAVYRNPQYSGHPIHAEPYHA